MVKRNSATRDKHRTIIARSRPDCYLCGHPIDWNAKYPDPECFVVDHVIPLAKGGPDTLDNKRACHHRCNSLKRARDYAPIIRRSGALGE